jgi:bifunctional non-homologous end joining protein LigD
VEKANAELRKEAKGLKMRSPGLIEPCLPLPAKASPAGLEWIHEIKHDGFRILALRDAAGVRLYTRNGNDFTKRFPLVVAAIATLPVRSCLQSLFQKPQRRGKSPN